MSEAGFGVGVAGIAVVVTGTAAGVVGWWRGVTVMVVWSARLVEAGLGLCVAGVVLMLAVGGRTKEKGQKDE
jgi:predicted phage tail protein